MRHLKSKKNIYYNGYVKTGEIPLKDSKIETIVQWLYDTHLVEWYVTYLLKKRLEDEDVEDKIQDIYVYVMETPQEKWDDLFEQGQFSVSGYVTGIIHQQLITDNSKIYRKYNKHHQRETRMDDVWWETYYNDGEKD
jgi:hypothetical protein